MICLYNKNESDFQYNGLGTLEPIECLFSCVINDVWKVEMTLPYDPEGKYKLIDNDLLLKITDIDAIAEQTSSYQLFRIYDYRKEDNGLFVAAYPVGLDARHDTYGTVTSSGKTAAQAIAQINGVSEKYTVSTDIEDTEKHTATWSKTNIIAMLNGEESFTSTWGGEIAYDNYNIKVNMALGRASGVGAPEVRYGKNIRGMSVEYDTSNVITRLYLYANSGEAYQSPGYVDATNASDYPIPHISYLVTPYNLIQRTDDGTESYDLTSDLYSLVRNNTASWLRDYLLTTWLKSHEMKWLVDNYALTMEKDGTEGICEYMWHKVINASGVVSNSTKSLIFEAMKEAFDNVLKNEDSASYIGSYVRSLKATGGGQSVYTYSWDTNNDYIYRPYSNTYVWIYASNKWNQLDSSGLTTGATDTGKWKWYKVSGKKWKRYGNKSKKRYLHEQEWEINGAFYQFGSDGHGVSGNDFLTARKTEFDYAVDSYGNTLDERIASDCKDYEDDLFDALYFNMSSYAMDLFTTERLSYPVPNITIDVVDLSKTTEYIGMEGLLRFKLGDTVKCINSKLGIETNLRVTGIVYDCIRKCNNQLTIGMTDNDLVNMFMKIGEVTDIEEYTAGDGIVINGKTISALPQGGVTDVIVGGQSVTYGGKAYIDIDEISGEGLQWFEETEDALYGVTDDIVTKMVDDGIYRGSVIHEDNTPRTEYWLMDIDSNDVVSIMIPLPTNEKPYSVLTMIPHTLNYGGVLLLSKDSSKLVAQYRCLSNDYAPPIDFRGSTGWSGENEETPINIQMMDTTTGSQTVRNSPHYAVSSHAEVDGENWYGLWICQSGYANLPNFDWTSIEEYVSVDEIPNHGGVIGFANVEELISVCASQSKTTEYIKYSGISREGRLAFFAGADDEHGTNAPIKIYNDGTYEGIGGVNDVKVDNVSVVTNNVANINTMTGATSQADGSKGLVPAPTTSDVDKYLKGDGTWSAVAGGGGGNALAYREMTPTDYENLSTAEKNNGVLYFVSDNATGVSGVTYIPISQSDYDNLTTAQKNNGIPYFVS